MINISILLMSIYIFIDTISYGVYEFQNNNKFAAITVFILSFLMIILVNISIFRFK